MPQYDAFLSYARDDDTLPDGSRADYDKLESFVRGLYDALTAADLKIWWDRECLPSQTTPFSAEIERGLHDSARVVLIVGPGAAASPWVQAEVREALRQCKAVTPLLVKGDFDLIPDALKLVSQIDARPPRELKHVIDDLLTELRREDRLGTPYGVRPLPSFYLPREGPYEAARAALVQDAISATVISAPPRAAAIYGMGGVGKSTLATALAEDCSLRRHFKDGILWIEVGQNPTVTDLQAAIGVTLGDDRDRYQNSPAEARIALSQTLHQHQALIVLDDVWDHRLIEDFPVSGTPCRLLVTTRSGTLAGAIQGADIRLELLTEAEGAALLAGTAGGAADNPVYRQLSAALGGQTLAVALAAARLKKRGPAYARTILDGLDDPTNPFTALAMHADDKDLNVEKSLWQSYRALEPDQQRRYRLLGVLTRDGSFDLKLAAALWGESEAAADRPLEELLDADLVQSATEGRYQQHRLLHAYARALLHREGEYDDAFGRYVDWVIAFSQQFKTLPPEKWGGLEPDLPHVHEVGDALVKLCGSDETYLERGLDFATNVSWYLFRRRQVRRLEWLELGLQAAPQLALKHPDEIDTYRRRESGFLNDLALAWSDLGEKRKALDFYEQALPLRRAVGDRGGEATTLNNMAAIYYQEGELERAVDSFEQVIAIFHQIGAISEESALHFNLAIFFQRMSRIPDAIAQVEESIRLQQSVNLPQDAGGGTIALKEQYLAELRSEPAPVEDPQAAFARQILALYQQGGAAAVRQALVEAGASAEVINGLIAQLETAAAQNPATSASGAVSTLPAETVQTLCANTVAVRTAVPDKLDEWQAQLTTVRADWLTKGADWEPEVAFIEALLAVLRGESPVLAESNPYAGVVAQVVKAVAG